MNKSFNPTREAESIIAEHTKGMVEGVHFEPEGNKELYDYMVESTTYILTDKLLKGNYTPMQYNTVQNELGDILWRIFQPYAETDETWGCK